MRRREDAVDSEDAGRRGAYCRLGPLCADDVARLEPAAAFLDGDCEAATDNRARRPPASSVAYYPDEGHVDPVEAVRALRAEARRLGATFLGNATVVDVACVGEGIAGNSLAGSFANGNPVGGAWVDTRDVEQRIAASNGVDEV